MNVLYTCDNNYVWLMGISMTSLFINNTHVDDICVYLIGDAISNENKKTLMNIASEFKRECCIIDAQKLDIPEFLYSNRWPKSAYNRLYAGQILPRIVDKIIYLDCDTIVNDDISEMWNIEMKDKCIYGVKDCIGKRYFKSIGLTSNEIYVNAGVLLMNVREIRKSDISDMISKFLKNNSKRIYYADQDILNGVFKEKKGVLAPEYDVMTLQAIYKYDDVLKLRKPNNYYSREEYECMNRNVKIIHYTTCMMCIRPWFINSNHPYYKQFENYRKKTKWVDKKPIERNKKKKSDIVINIVNKLPKKISYYILGFLHSVLLPIWINIKSVF